MSFNENQELLEKMGISPIKSDYVSVVTGEIVKRGAPTSLKDSYAVISSRLQSYYDSKPKTICDDLLDEDIVPSVEEELFYSTPEEVCKLNVDILLKYLETMVKDYKPKTLFIDRVDTTITYGEVTKIGERKEYGRMRMSNNGVLHAIYELIRVRFADEFKEQVSMSFNGWSLDPYISEETDVTFSSNRKSDIIWMKEEQEYIRDRTKQKRGLIF